jgi:hypothetical protein
MWYTYDSFKTVVGEEYVFSFREESFSDDKVPDLRVQLSTLPANIALSIGLLRIVPQAPRYFAPRELIASEQHQCI